MSTDGRFSFTPNVVIGIGIILLGVALLLERLDVVEARAVIQFWPVLLILFGTSMVIQALRGGPQSSSGGSQEKLTGFWILLVIVGLLSWQAHRRSEIAAAGPQADTVTLLAVMGGDHRASAATPFRGGEMTSIMGQTRLDLRQATIAPGEEAVIEIVALMGGAVIHVSREWAVDVQTLPIMGRVRDERALLPEEIDEADRTLRGRRRGRDRVGLLRGGDDVRETLEPLEPPIDGRPPPRVVLRGFIMMGGLTIRS